MVRHTVVFKLKFARGSPEETEFLQAAAKLSALPGVLHFESLRQTSKKMILIMACQWSLILKKIMMVTTNIPHTRHSSKIIG